jgi:flagellar assembly factor FliW
MLVNTTRFGQMEVTQEQIVLFPQGLIGFETCRHWVILPDSANADVAWLQSISQGQVALPIMSPRKLVRDYRVNVSRRQLSAVTMHASDRVFVLTVISKTGKTLTTNLRSPLIINMTRRLGCQVVTDDAQPLALPLEFSPPMSQPAPAAVRRAA